MTLIEQLRRDEGTGPKKNGRFMPYRDTGGYLTIGYGRNLDANGLSSYEVGLMLENDIADAYSALSTALPWSIDLDPPRRAVLANMVFNMGIEGLLGFHKTLYFIQTGDYASAASAMLSSKWARQVGNRARRLAYQMRYGEWI